MPEVVDAFGAAQEGELDQDGDAAYVGLALIAEEPGARFERATRGEEVIDEDDPAAGLDGVDVDLEAVRAVLEVVVGPVDLSGELAGLSDGHEARRKGLGDGGAEDEAPALGPHDQLDALAAVGIGHQFDGQSQARRVGEQRRKVLEHDARLRVVRDVPDEPT